MLPVGVQHVQAQGAGTRDRLRLDRGQQVQKAGLAGAEGTEGAEGRRRAATAGATQLFCLAKTAVAKRPRRFAGFQASRLPASSRPDASIQRRRAVTSYQPACDIRVDGLAVFEFFLRPAVQRKNKCKNTLLVSARAIASYPSRLETTHQNRPMHTRNRFLCESATPEPRHARENRQTQHQILRTHTKQSAVLTQHRHTSTPLSLPCAAWKRGKLVERPRGVVLWQPRKCTEADRPFPLAFFFLAWATRFPLNLRTLVNSILCPIAPSCFGLILCSVDGQHARAQQTRTQKQSTPDPLIPRCAPVSQSRSG